MSINLDDYFISIESIDNFENNDIEGWIKSSKKPERLEKKLTKLTECGGSFTSNGYNAVSTDFIEIPFVCRSNDKWKIQMAPARFIHFSHTISTDLDETRDEDKSRMSLDITQDLNLSDRMNEKVNQDESINNIDLNHKSKKRKHSESNRSDVELTIKSPKTKQRKLSSEIKEVNDYNEVKFMIEPEVINESKSEVVCNGTNGLSISSNIDEETALTESITIEQKTSEVICSETKNLNVSSNEIIDSANIVTSEKKKKKKSRVIILDESQVNSVTEVVEDDDISKNVEIIESTSGQKKKKKKSRKINDDVITSPSNVTETTDEIMVTKPESSELKKSRSKKRKLSKKGENL